MRERALVQRSGLSAQLYNDLLNSILSGDLSPGAKLPTEYKLASDYGVSRSTVRAALARLKDEQYVHSQQGSGTVVADSPLGVSKPFAPVESLSDLEKCYDCRMALEAEIAYRVARLRDADDLAYLDHHLTAMERMVMGREPHTAEDTEFHLRLSAMTRNHFFHSIMLSIRPHILFGMNLSKTLSQRSRDRHASMSFEEHRDVIQAIKKRDADAARGMMGHHIEASRRRVFEGQ